jgi:transglutaminase-like putative cysteine protease
LATRSFGNYQARIVFPDKIKELTVEVEVIAKLQVINPFDYFVEEYEEFPFTYDQMLQQELTAYLNLSEESPIFLKFMEGLKLNQSIPTNDFLVSINQAVYKELSYNLRMEVGVQTPEETLRIKSGSCRDFAWLLIHVLRHFGLAARFVSGYIVQLSPDVKSLDGPSGPEKILQIYMPGLKFIYQVGGLDLIPLLAFCKRRTYSIVLYTTL